MTSPITPRFPASSIEPAAVRLTRRGFLGAAAAAVATACSNQHGGGSRVLPTLTSFRKIEAPGTLQSMFPGYALTTHQGARRSIAAVLNKLDANGLQQSAELPHAELRSYGRGLELSDGTVAIPYQSTEGFLGTQDGLQHGVVVVEGGRVLADHNLFAANTVRPSALFEIGGKLLVLATNGSIGTTEGQVLFNDDSALVTISDPRNSNISPSAQTLIGRKNANTGGVDGDQLIIADNAGTLMGNGTIRIPTGLAIGALAVGDENLLLSGRGVNPVIVNGNSIRNLTGFDEPNLFIPGGQFLGNSVVLPVQSQLGFAGELILVNSLTGEKARLETPAANFVLGALLLGERTVITGHGDVNTDSHGDPVSEIHLWRAA